LGLVLSVVVGLVLVGRDVSDGGVEKLVVEPVDPFRGAEFDAGQAVPVPAGLIGSALQRSIRDSMRALSKASPTAPIEASMPAPIRWAVNAKDVYWTDRGTRGAEREGVSYP
jgi:hypothetical protein